MSVVVKRPSRRGRVYKCRKCDFQGQKQAAHWHIIKMHCDAEQVPFYCSLCNYRANNLKSLQQHVKGFKPHLGRRATIPECVEDESFFKQADHPYQVTSSHLSVDDNTDLQILSNSDSCGIWRQRTVRRAEASGNLLTVNTKENIPPVPSVIQSENRKRPATSPITSQPPFKKHSDLLDLEDESLFIPDYNELSNLLDPLPPVVIDIPDMTAITESSVQASATVLTEPLLSATVDVPSVQSSSHVPASSSVTPKQVPSDIDLSPITPTVHSLQESIQELTKSLAPIAHQSNRVLSELKKTRASMDRLSQSMTALAKAFTANPPPRPSCSSSMKSSSDPVSASPMLSTLFYGQEEFNELWEQQGSLQSARKDERTVTFNMN